MPSPPDLSGSKNNSFSIGKGSPLEVSAGMMFSLIIASDVSKRAEEEDVVLVMKLTLCFTSLLRHACAFCGFVLAMSSSFHSSFFCSALLLARNLSHVSWIPMTELSTLAPSVTCTFDPSNVSRARSIFSFFTITWHFGALTKYPYPGPSVFTALNVSYRSDILHIGRISVHTHFYHLHTIYGLSSPLRVSVSGGGSQLRRCTLQADHLAW